MIKRGAGGGEGGEGTGGAGQYPAFSRNGIARASLSKRRDYPPSPPSPLRTAPPPSSGSSSSLHETSRLLSRMKHGNRGIFDILRSMSFDLVDHICSTTKTSDFFRTKFYGLGSGFGLRVKRSAKCYSSNLGAKPRGRKKAVPGVGEKPDRCTDKARRSHLHRRLPCSS